MSTLNAPSRFARRTAATTAAVAALAGLTLAAAPASVAAPSAAAACTLSIEEPHLDGGRILSQARMNNCNGQYNRATVTLYRGNIGWGGSIYWSVMDQRNTDLDQFTTSLYVQKGCDAGIWRAEVRATGKSSKTISSGMKTTGGC
ncbi:hypothetical protein ACFV0B_33315 [Streptomyces xanthophaeus]|uniref:hypothetical protein n=1 Tax=Streptomyces xanthophaeus TaxID=67385 RepID=UPI0036466C24